MEPVESEQVEVERNHPRKPTMLGCPDRPHVSEGALTLISIFLRLTTNKQK